MAMASPPRTNDAAPDHSCSSFMAPKPTAPALHPCCPSCRSTSPASPTINETPGETINRSDDYTAADLADDAAALIASLAPKAHVWGNSYGGMVAQELALRHPRCIDSLVLGVTFQRGASALANPDPSTRCASAN